MNTTLLQAAKNALADLEGVMPEVEPSGDRTHPGWKTIDELKAAIENVKPVKLTAVVTGGVLEDLYAENIEANIIECDVIDFDAFECGEEDAIGRTEDQCDAIIFALNAKLKSGDATQVV